MMRMKQKRARLIPGLLLILLAAGTVCGQSGSGMPSHLQKIPSWKGIFTIKIIGPASQKNSDNDCDYQSSLHQAATYSGIFSQDPFIMGKTVLRMAEGKITASVDDETFEVGGDTKTRYTVQGTQTHDICNLLNSHPTWPGLLFRPTAGGYELDIPETPIAARHTVFEPNEPQHIFQGPDPGDWIIPGCKVTSIPYPAKYVQLTGSRRVKVMADPPGGDQVEINAEVTWDIEPSLEPAPLKPLK